MTGDADRRSEKKVVLLGISGPSSSGKTTVAKIIQNLFKGSVIIHEDDFYLPDDKIPYDEVRKQYNWDSPDCVKFDELKDTLAKIKDPNSGFKYDVKTYEMDTTLKLSENELDQISKIIRTSKKYNLDDPQVKVYILEGFLLFDDPEILDLLDIKLFFQSDYKTLRDRRYARTGYNTVAGFWEDPPLYFEQFVWPEYFKSHKCLFQCKQELNGDKLKFEEDIKLNCGTPSNFAKSHEIGFFYSFNDTVLNDLVISSVEYILKRL